MDVRHRQEWPDKILFSGMTLLLAAALGTLFDIGRLADISIGADWFAFLDAYPAWVSLSLNMVAGAFAVIAIRSQAWIPVALGAVAAIVSVGFLLIVPVLALMSLAFMVLAFREREEVTWDQHVMQSHLWPDKAIAASMLLATSAVVSIAHAIYLYGDQVTPVVAPANPAIQATWMLLMAGVMVWGARCTFRLRGGQWGQWGAVAAFLAGGFYFLTPVLGVLAFILIGLAEKESEFETGVTA